MRLSLILTVFSVLLMVENTIGQRLLSLETANKLSIAIENIGIEDGLSQGMINDVVEDSLGYLWVATKDGLNRYDGSGFKIFRHDPTDSTSISDNFVYSLLVDSKGRLWVGTQSNGVNLFDPSTERFLRFGKKQLGSKFIGEVLEDGRGNILVETLDSSGYQVLIPQNEFIRSVNDVTVKPMKEFYPVFQKMEPHPEVSKFMHFDGLGGLWYFRQDTIFHADSAALMSGSGRYHSFIGLIDMAAYFDSPPFPVFLENGSGEIYITDWNNTLYQFDRITQAFHPSIRLPKGYKFKENLMFDDQGHLWCIANDLDYFRIDPSTKSLEVYSPEWNRFPSDMPKLHSGFFLQDGNGNIWSGTGGSGLLKISGKLNRFKTLADHRSNIVETYRTFRTEVAGGRSTYDASAAETTIPILRKPAKELKQSDDFKLSSSNGHITLDSKGGFWTGAFDADSAFLVRIDTKDRLVERIGSVGLLTSSWYAMPVFLDAEENVWFSEKYNEQGVNLYRYEPKSKELRTFPFPIDRAKYKYRFVSDWEFDKDGKLWLGTMYGVFSFNPNTEQWRHFEAQSERADQLSSNQILSVCIDPRQGDSILWVGTEGAGLNRLNVLNGSVKRFDVTNALPNNVVYGILPDKRGNLWLSTNFGLCLFNPTNFKSQNYSTLDGLPHNEFNRYEFSKDTSGNLYFGSMGGVVYFNPDDFYTEGKKYQPIISSLALFNRPVQYGKLEQGFELPAPIENCFSLTFRHDADMISFGFSLLDLTAPKKNRFRYRLLGLSEEWVEIPHNGLATFTDLSSGNYTLQVLGMGSDNVWSTEPTIMNIRILAPWYGTWWFRSLLVLLVLATVYGLYRYRLAQLLRVERMRNRIAQDLHDDIGSTLSSISLYGSVLKQKLGQADEQSLTLLDRITSSTKEMMESMNDMVWTIKADNDRFEHVIYRMRAFAANLCESKGIQLNFKEGEDVLSIQLDMEIRKNIYLLYKEAITNAVKYANASNIEVTIDTKGQQIRLVIQDDGVGFDLEEVDKDTGNLGGNGLRSMKKRAQEMGGQLTVDSNNGVKVELIIQS